MLGVGADDMRGVVAVHVPHPRLPFGNVPLLQRQVREPPVRLRRTERLWGQLRRGEIEA